ncbi:MAG TPA: glycosyltransferase [Tepidisphaeraceae bacterium]|jgi:glycosyltransferase involved in cell wall biosynthesis
MPQRPLKLLIVLIEIHGGTGVFCRNLAAALRRFYPDDYQIDLLLLRKGSATGADRQLFNHIEELGATVHDDWRRFTETLPNALQVKRAIQRLDPDVIFALHNWPSVIVPAVAPKRRVILSVHGHLSTLLRANITRPLVRWLIRRRYRKRLVIVPTQAIADDLLLNFNVSRTKVIPHGIDVDRVHALAEEPATDLPPRPYIVALGHLVPAKDYPTLLRAFAEAKAKGFSHHLAIIGEGELDQALNDLASSLNANETVHFLGKRENPYPYLKHAQFFVLASATEGFGLALLEAMALGLPCLSTNTAGPMEILSRGKHGMLVPVGDPSALAAAMITLANDPVRRDELSRAALARVQHFGFETMARAYHELFHQS